jgi:hypothetical protein
LGRDEFLLEHVVLPFLGMQEAFSFAVFVVTTERGSLFYRCGFFGQKKPQNEPVHDHFS